jgi:predicted ABC-type ATPase
VSYSKEISVTQQRKNILVVSHKQFHINGVLSRSKIFHFIKNCKSSETFSMGLNISIISEIFLSKTDKTAFRTTQNHGHNLKGFESSGVRCLVLKFMLGSHPSAM